MSSFDKNNKIEDEELKIIVDDEDDQSESNRLVIDENVNNDNEQDQDHEQINSSTKQLDDRDLQKQQQQQTILASVFTEDFLNNRQQVNLATAFCENFLTQHQQQQQQQNYDIVSNDDNNRLVPNTTVDSNNNTLINSLLTRNNNNSISTPATLITNNSSRDDNDFGSIYRGLYPINEVKQYFRKTNVGTRRLYKCLWDGCNYETWKYSQHISRHIYLKHIGIKKLECNIGGCKKLFKRPESLVQHKKNHSCGFGIDNQIMKDPNSQCGVRNIKRYFSRTLDNDIYVYQCKYGNCRFHTHNSGSIRRHVHNQHVCPYSSPANANYLNQNRNQEGNYNQRTTMNNAQPNISLSSSLSSNQLDFNPVDISSQQSSPSSMINNVTCEVQVQIDEESVFDPMKNKFVTQNSIMNYQADDSQQKQQNQHNSGQVDDSTGDDEDEDDEDDDGQDDEDDSNSIEDNSILLENIRNGIPNMQFPNSDVDIEDDDNGGDDSKNSSKDSSNHQQSNNDHSNDNNNNNGLYSLKNFKGKYRKVKMNDNDKDGRDVKFICNQCGFQANSQINLVRHLWSESNFNEFVCENCQRKFPTEFMLYSHRKSEHRGISPATSPPPPPPQPLSLSLKNESNIKNNNNETTQQNQQKILNPSIFPMIMHRNNNIDNNHNVEVQNNFNSTIYDQMLKYFQEILQNPNYQRAIPEQQLQNQQVLDFFQLSYPSTSSIINHQEMKKPINFSQLYKKIIGENDDSVQYNCLICSNYTVRTKASMNKHLKNHHSDLINNNNNNNNSLSPMQIETNSEQAIDENNEDKHLQPLMNEDHDLNQSVQTILDEQDQALSPGKKYKGHDKSGLYSLKKFPDYYKRIKVEPSGYQYECTKCHGEQEYATRSQASMVRHIWQHKPQDFKCPICQYGCENEFALYKHKKKEHPESTSQHNRTKSTCNSSNRSRINSFNNNNNIQHSPSPIDQNLDLDRMDQDQLIQNPHIITDQCQRSMNFNNNISGSSNIFEMEQEQDYPISMVKNEYNNNQTDQIIQNNRKRFKTSRRSLHFKKYNPIQFKQTINQNVADTNDDSFKENPEFSEDNDEEEEEEEFEIAENSTEKSFGNKIVKGLDKNEISNNKENNNQSFQNHNPKKILMKNIDDLGSNDYNHVHHHHQSLKLLRRIMSTKGSKEE